MKTKEAIKKIKNNIENIYFRIDIGFGFTSVINGFGGALGCPSVFLRKLP